MAPVYFDIGLLFFAALGLIGLIFTGVGAGLAKNRAIGAIVGMAIFFALLVIAAKQMGDSSKDYSDGLAKMNADRKASAERSLAIMQKRCKSDERFVVIKPVLVGSSVFVNLYRDTKAPTAVDAPSVIRTAEMNEQQRRYGNSFPPSYSDEQYREPISWIDDANRPQTIAEFMQTDLVDSRERFETNGKKYSRLATKQGWLKDGLSDVAIAYTENHIDEYKFRNWPNGKFMVSVPIDKPGAQYVFTVEDISTLDDRKDWLARGRLRLLDASDSVVVAEYVGFQSLLRKADVCPNAINGAASNNGEWDMLRFFFGRILQKE